MSKKRLDLLLLERGLAESREKARALIMAGEVFADGERVDKAGAQISEGAELEVRVPLSPFVSRGGKKLAKALESFDISLEGLVCADIGASTGGFTDCMLQNGATRVYAVDVGYGQLAWKLRSDERVVCLERRNARHLTAEDIPEELDFAGADVSFISLRLIFPALVPLMKEGAAGVFLIKPQFEAGREKVGKKGVVRDAAVHVEVINAVLGYLEENGLRALSLDFSPIKGPEGNIEYLVYAKKEDGKRLSGPNADTELPFEGKYSENSTQTGSFRERDGLDAQAVVERAHESLD
ncbi:MAG: TlyA family RNA methyltransferase [Oscillospiraceae bacterium]|nr:TlyA family RNA methyltransferase [Oscillospiraceae bacterium]